MALLRECLNELRLRIGEAGVLEMPSSGVRSGLGRDARATAARSPGRAGTGGVDRAPALGLLPAPRTH
jgi:hypothetical protein